MKLRSGDKSARPLTNVLGERIFRTALWFTRKWLGCISRPLADQGSSGQKGKPFAAGYGGGA